jgi:acetylglutamate kinase
MRSIVKIGGVLLSKPAFAVKEIQRVSGGETVLVHGGGVQITRMLEQMKVESKFIDGLRVTDDKTLKAVVMALLGEVHSELVLHLRLAGLPAVGLFGAIRASKKSGPWGLVGTDLKVEADSLIGILKGDQLPVVPTVAIGESSLLNINGDETAAAVAIALNASSLIFLTDVEGVKDAAGKVFEQVDRADELLKADFVSGGMIPKLRAVKAAMDAGIPSVRVGRTTFGQS